MLTASSTGNDCSDWWTNEHSTRAVLAATRSIGAYDIGVCWSCRIADFLALSLSLQAPLQTCVVRSVRPQLSPPPASSACCWFCASEEAGSSPVRIVRPTWSCRCDRVHSLKELSVCLMDRLERSNGMLLVLKAVGRDTVVAQRGCGGRETERVLFWCRSGERSALFLAIQLLSPVCRLARLRRKTTDKDLHRNDDPRTKAHPVVIAGGTRVSSPSGV